MLPVAKRPPEVPPFWENAVFWLLLGLHLLPLWSYRYWLTCDGPAHLYNAWLHLDLLRHPQQLAHELLSFNHNPEPNYLAHLLLEGLLLLAPPWLAEKLVLTLYVAGLPLALRHLLRFGPPGAGWLAVLGFPFVYSVLLAWGFYNFCLSLVLLLLVLAYWQRHAGPGWTRRAWVGLAGLVSLLFLAHPLTYLVAGLLLGLLALAGSGHAPAPGRARQLGTLLLAYAPTLPALGWYFWHKGTAAHLPALSYAVNLREWLTLEPLHYAGPAEAVGRGMLAGLLLAAVVTAAVLARRGAVHRPLLPWGLALLGLLAAYVAAPDELAAGSILRPRWGVLSYLVLLAALAQVPWPRRLRQAGLLAGAGLAGALLGVRWQQQHAAQAALADYRSALPYLRPRSTLLALVYNDSIPGARGTVPVLSHAAGYLGAERQLLCFANYEAETGYFPLLWRPGKAPAWKLGERPPLLRPAAETYVADYVLLWARTVAPGRYPKNVGLLTDYLTRHRYVRRYRSPAGLVELYERPPPAR